jgi:hypothetical protein
MGCFPYGVHAVRHIRRRIDDHVDEAALAQEVERPLRMLIVEPGLIAKLGGHHVARHARPAFFDERETVRRAGDPRCELE